jgi:hypothetical protein
VWLECLLQLPSRLGEDDRIVSPFFDEGDLVDRTGASELPGPVDDGMDLLRVLTPGIEVQLAEDVAGVDFEGSVVEDSHSLLGSRLRGPIRDGF